MFKSLASTCGARLSKLRNDNYDIVNAIDLIDSYASNKYIILSDGFNVYLNREHKSWKRMKIIFITPISLVLFAIRLIVSELVHNNKYVTYYTATGLHLLGNTKIITIMFAIVFVGVIILQAVNVYFETSNKFFIIKFLNDIKIDAN